MISIITSLCIGLYQPTDVLACSKALEASSYHTPLFNNIEALGNKTYNKLIDYTGQDLWWIIGLGKQIGIDKRLKASWSFNYWIPIDEVITEVDLKNPKYMVTLKIDF